jgi:hypothetical protein
MPDLLNALLGNQFPSWVIRKIGYPILTEANFGGTYPNTKFGILESSTGTVTNDTTDLFWGGTGCAKMLTAATNGDGSEIKCTIEPVCQPGDLLAFEQKWAQSFAQGTTEFQVGLEARSKATIFQSRFSWTNSTGVWKYQSSAGVFSDMSALAATGAGTQPSAVTDNPAVNTAAGTPVSWTRIVIDPYNRMHHSFEAPLVNAADGAAYSHVWDMRGIPLVSNGVASRALYLPFTYVITHTATAEPGFTTDWCVSVIPQGVNPNAQWG